MNLTDEEKKLIEQHRAGEEAKRRHAVTKERLNTDLAWLKEWLTSHNLELRTEWTGGSGSVLVLEYKYSEGGGVEIEVGERMGKQ